MSLNPNALGSTSEPRTFTWTDRDTLLYALSLGAGVEDLALTTENTKGVRQQVLPTYAVIACANLDALKHVGRVDWARLLHGAQSVRVPGPLPNTGSLSVISEIAILQDKGEGRNAVIGIRAIGRDPETGAVLAEAMCTLVIRGAGGFGGEPGESAPTPQVPGRAPDAEVSALTREDQALLYRLNGDRNPLHSDPAFAQRAGFAKPIMHGLCTFGFAGRALAAGLTGGDAEAVRALEANFISPVFPGELLTTSMWRAGAGTAVFRTEASATDGRNRRVVLDSGRVEYIDSRATNVLEVAEPAHA